MTKKPSTAVRGQRGDRATTAEPVVAHAYRPPSGRRGLAGRLPPARAHARADGPLELARLTDAQPMQVRAVGRASSRAGATAAPHSSHRP